MAMPFRAMRRVGAVALIAALLAVPARADPPPWTLEGVVRAAMMNLPAVRLAGATEALSAARVDAARSDLWPDVRVGAQLNRGTGNVVPGATFALPGIPAVSGPPTGRAFDQGGWGTSLSVSLAWNVADLSRRMTLVDAALAEHDQAVESTAARRLQAGADAAEAFLLVVAADAVVHAAQAGVERARALVALTRPLVAQSLRPALDLARAESELASASIVLVRAEQQAELRRARLAEAVGAPGTRPAVIVGALLDAPPAPTPARAERHPLLRESDVAVRVAELRQRAVSLEYLPRVDLVAALWLRGGGAFGAGPDLGGAQGLLPDTPNWAVGVVVAWPVLELFAVRARSRVAEGQSAVLRARRVELEQSVAGQIDAARVMLDGARRVTEHTEPALAAARAAESQATSRYRAGLATLLDVADAQRTLTAAEVDAVSANIEVRRATLLLARALGDLTPFLADVGDR